MTTYHHDPREPRSVMEPTRNVLTNADFLALEALIDRTSVQAVVDAIGGICHEKGAHIDANWQDRPLARVWYHTGDAVMKCAGRLVK